MALSLVLAACNVVQDLEEDPPKGDSLEPLSFDVEIRGGNNDHTPIEATLSFDLTGTKLGISGSIDWVDNPPSQATIRRGNFWAHVTEPGEVVAEYPLDADFDGPVDLSHDLALTEEQALELRNGSYYLEIDSSGTTLGPILPSDEIINAGGQIQVELSGLPAGATAWIRFLTEQGTGSSRGTECAGRHSC